VTRPPVKDQPARLKPTGGAAPGPESARYYDLDVADERDDIDMYLALAAASDGPILELACGSGRICVPLAAAGHDVTGIDIDPDMLDRARQAWSRAVDDDPETGALTLVQADATAVSLGRRFDLVILGFNSLLVIGDGEPSAQQAALATMTRHLSTVGRAVVDTWLPTAADLALYDGRLIHDWTREDPETGEQVSKTTSATYDPETGRATIETIFDAWRQGDAPRRSSRRDEVRFPTRTELLSMIESAGLAPQIIAGDYDTSPIDPESDRVIIVAARGPGPVPRRRSTTGSGPVRRLERI
jgi:SAM-dependent methyltransferase